MLLRMDQNENESEKVKQLPKLPFKRLQWPLSQIVNTAIPLHVQLLNEHSKNIETLKNKNQPLQLRQEQSNACKTLQLLKDDLYQIEQLNLQVQDEDQEVFEKTIRKSLKDAVDAISEFMVSHSDVLGPLLDLDNDLSQESAEFPKLVCGTVTDSDIVDESKECIVENCPIDSQLVVHDHPTSRNWSFLRKQLLEVHSLIHQFASLVFRQQDSIDNIQSNIVETHENVRIGTSYLKKASLLKAATFPIAGAVVGGILLGPVGALAGFKLLGSVACMAGGSAIGYGAGLGLKKKSQDICNSIELKPLKYESKSISNSSPDLYTDVVAKQEN
ncbi:Syntaxin-17 like protein [Argiope bruennichi]|uniref:Syntaxin-17 like protein n=1 Tax=Argiope bruennichi TaxID=94029 RepID=A0A8T0EP00_ARGBR|nr:Syntaxin-17 like protein [Argiope bruennichi]